MANKLLLLILLCILSSVLAQQIIKALSGQEVDLECNINSTENVTWYTGLGSLSVYICNNNHLCSRTQTESQFDNFYQEFKNVYRNNEASVLSLIPSQNDQNFQCEIGNQAYIETYRVVVINPKKIEKYCNVALPSNSKSEVHRITLVCGFTLQADLHVDLHAKLTLAGLGQNSFEVQNSSQSINGTLAIDGNFNNITNACCEINFTDIDHSLHCPYPKITTIKYSVKDNDAVFEWDDGLYVNWHLFDKDGNEEILDNISWIRDGGQSLLIRGISEYVGKVVVYRNWTEEETNNDTIGIAVISGNNEYDTIPSSDDPPFDPTSSRSPFFVLTLLFLALWLITFVVGGIVLFCRDEKCKTSLSDFPSTSDEARSPNSNQSSNVKPNGNVGSGENGTPLVRFTTEATNPDISNTNNSAHTPVLERDDGKDDTLNRQSQGDSHLYFTLEKSPSASFRRASAPRWNPGEANPATLDQDKDSHWQGYATVADSNENATCSYDLGEYAEVGEHLLGKGPPVQSIRPPVRKKPGREEVKEDDISKLYGKVNK